MAQTATAISDLKARGFVLHPLKGKIPQLKEWQKLKETPEIIDNHFENGGNVGAVCGKVSNITVIDLDSFLFAPEIFGAGIETLKASRTEGRGHIYFRYNPNLPASKHHDLGIEILSDGNNVVLPPSVHPSGDTYHWKNPATPIIEMPQDVEKNLIQLFTTETELKRMLAKCRHCFRKAISEKPEVHGAEGREYMLAMCTDLKAQGATESHIKVFAKLMYGAKFDETRTLQEWQNIDPAKTWTCGKLREKCAAHIDLNKCEQCKARKEAYTNPPQISEKAQYTDVGNAHWFVQLHGRNIKYVPSWKAWMVWDKTRWVMRTTEQMTPYVEQLASEMRRQADNMIDSGAAEELRKYADKSESYNKMLACIKVAQNHPAILCDHEAFDQNKYLINFANGTLDLKTGILRDFNRDDMMTKISPVPFDPTKPYPIFSKFLNEIFEGKQELIKYIQTLFGMCMTGDVSQEQLFIFWGASGGNGKGTLVEIISYILNEYRVALPIASLSAHAKNNIPNDIAMLKGARLCTVNEPKDNEPLDAGKIKEITDKGQISARFLGKEFFKFWQTHHTIITTNPQPNIRMDGGMRRRLVLVPFYYSPEVIDINLDVKLRTEAPQIIGWMLEGCLRWQKEGLIQPQEIKDAVTDYHESMDPLTEFWNVCIEVDILHAQTPSNLLYTIYKLWCEANEIRAQSHKTFTQTIIRKSIKGVKKHLGYDKNGMRCQTFIGLRGTSKAVEIALRYKANPSAEREWAIEQFQQWESWKPATPIEKIMRSEDTSEVIKGLHDRFGNTKPAEFEVDAYIKAWDEDISDEDRAKIVVAYLTTVSDQNQRDRIKTLRDIIRDNQGKGATPIEIIISKSQEAGIEKRDMENMIQKLKSSGGIIEVSENRYRVV